MSEKGQHVVPAVDLKTDKFVDMPAAALRIILTPPGIGLYHEAKRSHWGGPEKLEASDEGQARSCSPLPLGRSRNNLCNGRDRLLCSARRPMEGLHDQGQEWSHDRKKSLSIGTKMCTSYGQVKVYHPAH